HERLGQSTEMDPHLAELMRAHTAQEQRGAAAIPVATPPPAVVMSPKAEVEPVLEPQLTTLPAPAPEPEPEPEAEPEPEPDSDLPLSPPVLAHVPMIELPREQRAVDLPD